jgi:hypothetical protein
MQRILTVFVLALACLAAGFTNRAAAQAVMPLAPSSVPLPAQQAFEKLHPGVKTVRWTAHNWRRQRHIVAHYLLNTERRFARFTEGGKLLSAGRLFRPGELPAGIRTAAQTQYPDAQLRWALEVQSAQNRARFFYVRLLRGKTILHGFYDADGAKLTEDQLPEVVSAQVESATAEE